MTHRFEIRYTMSDGTGVNEDPITADDSSVQHDFVTGGAIIYLYRGGVLVETLSYRRVDRIRRFIDPPTE